jgi:hypothetical protein
MVLRLLYWRFGHDGEAGHWFALMIGHDLMIMTWFGSGAGLS